MGVAQCTGGENPLVVIRITDLRHATEVIEKYVRGEVRTGEGGKDPGFPSTCIISE